MADSGTYTPETLARRAKIAQQLISSGIPPIRNWQQGVGELAEKGLGYYMLNRTEEKDASARKEAIAQALEADRQIRSGGQTPAPSPVAAPIGAPASPTTEASNQVPIGSSRAADDAAGPYGSAIANIESGGKYDAQGPIITSGPMAGQRALGKYQVMESNVAPWTKAHLGKELTPQEFLASPESQDAVFKGQFGQYASQYGPNGAARAWFAGPGGMNDPNRSDQLGTTVSSYADRFDKGIPAIAATLNRGPSGTPPAAANAPGGPPPTQVAQNAPAGNGGRDAAIASMFNPWTPPALSNMLSGQLNPTYGFQTLPDGTIIRTDPRHGTVQPIYQAPTKPTWGVIGETADGGKQYGWIDPGKKIGGAPGIEPYNATGSAASATVTGPDGKPLAIPPGVNAKEFVKRVSESTADALTGKKTEVQAKDEKFANKMELAEKNVGGIEGEGKSLWNNVMAHPWAVGGNYLQSDKFQKYQQAKNNFITALLRDESGAAIGTSEFVRYEKEMFPQPGDGKDVIDQKREARRIAIEAMKKGAGPGYKSPTEAATAPNGVDPKVWDVMTPQERALWK